MINSFTLSQLIEMSGDNRQGLIRECFTASSDNRMEIFRFPCRIDAFVIGVGTEGETSVSLNLHEYRLKKNSIFIFSPKNILQVKSEEYFRANVIVVSPDFLRRINIDTKNLLQLFLQFAANPCLTLTHEESHSIRSFIAQIERETRGKETHFTHDIINGLIAATIYKVGDVLYNYLSEHPKYRTRYTTGPRSTSSSSRTCWASTTAPNAAWDSMPANSASRPNTSRRSSNGSAGCRFRSGSTTT